MAGIFKDKTQLRDAFRLAIQSAVAAATSYTLLTWFQMPEVFVGVLSAVLVVEPSIGSTMGSAKGRVLSTFIGSLIGFACNWALPLETGVITSLVLSIFIINGIASYREEWRYGTVAAVAISLGADQNVLDISIDRLISIGIGVLIGLVVSLVFWPEKAETRAKRHIKNALVAAKKRFEIAIANTREKELQDSSKQERHFHNRLNHAKEAASAIQLVDSEAIRELIAHTEKLYNSILIIQRIGAEVDEGITDKKAGIKQQSEDILLDVCHVLDDLSKGEKIQDSQLNKLRKHLKSMEEHMNLNHEDQELIIKRHAFIFGMKQVEQSLKEVVDSFEG